MSKLTIKNHPTCPNCGSKNTRIIPRNCSCSRTWEGSTCWSSPYCEDCDFTGFANSEGIFWYSNDRLTNIFLKTISKQEKLDRRHKNHFKKCKLPEVTMLVAIKTLEKFHSSPDVIVPTVDGGIQFIFYIDDRTIEFEIFDDGDVVFSEDYFVIDVPKDQLDDRINIINKWIDEYE